MTGNGPAVLAAAAGVAVGHAILPDHWVPLAVLGRTRRYPLSRVARLSALAGVAHVLVSIVLGGVIILIGLQLRSSIGNAQDAIVGGILLATGAGFLLLELSGRGHHHRHDGAHAHDHHAADGHAHHDHLADDHPAESHAHHHHDPDLGAAGPAHHGHHDHPPGADRYRPRRLGGLAAVMVPFGAAASPDLTILPVFVAATTAGVATAVGSVLVFAAMTIGTIVGLTLAAARGGYQIKGEWLEHWGNAVTAVVLLVIGALVLAGII